MKYRRFGKTGLEVSEIGYGAWGIGGKFWQGGTDEESHRALRRAIELGINFIDTALVYGDGHSEKLVGKAVREAKHRVHVATKIHPKNRLWPARPGIGLEEAFPTDYIIRSTEDSLRNLKLDTVDLQQLHVWNPEWLERDEWKRAFEELKTAGKVRAVGVSTNDHEPDSVLELVRLGLIDAVQVIYNIFEQSPARNLLPLAARMNVGVVARVPLDEGSLTGAIREDTVFDPKDFRSAYFRGDRKKQVVERVHALEADLAGAAPGSLAETALRFSIAPASVSAAIPGMRSVHNVERNVRVSGQEPLAPDVLEILKRHAWDKNFYR